MTSVPHDTHRDAEEYSIKIGGSHRVGSVENISTLEGTPQKTNMSSKKEAMFPRKVKIVFQPSFLIGYYRVSGWVRDRNDP